METQIERQRRKAKEACLRKVAYPNRKMARKAARFATKGGGGRVGYYKCPYCGQYHTYDKRKKERGKERIRAAKRRSMAEQIRKANWEAKHQLGSQYPKPRR
jgi:hypothetical protein